MSLDFVFFEKGLFLLPNLIKSLGDLWCPLELPLSDLLDVDLYIIIREQSSQQGDRKTYSIRTISETKCPQVRPHLCKRLVLRQTFRSVGLHSAINDFKCHGWHHEFCDADLL